MTSCGFQKHFQTTIWCKCGKLRRLTENNPACTAIRHYSVSAQNPRERKSALPARMPAAALLIISLRRVIVTSIAEPHCDFTLISRRSQGINPRLKPSNLSYSDSFPDIHSSSISYSLSDCLLLVCNSICLLLTSPFSPTLFTRPGVNHVHLMTHKQDQCKQ